MRPGWESLLAAHVAGARTKAFAWGSHDCALWCADWLLALTGTDHAASLRGTYATEAGALAALAARGHSDWWQFAAAVLPEIPVPLARRGDVVLHPVNGCLGLCEGAFAYFVTTRGLTRLPTRACPRAWSVR